MLNTYQINDNIVIAQHSYCQIKKSQLWIIRHMQFGNINTTINAFHEAGECRRQVKNVTNLVTNVHFLNVITIFGFTMRNAFK